MRPKRKRFSVVWRADGQIEHVSGHRFSLLAWRRMRRLESLGPWRSYTQYGYWGVLDNKTAFRYLAVE